MLRRGIHPDVNQNFFSNDLNLVEPEESIRAGLVKSHLSFPSIFPSGGKAAMERARDALTFLNFTLLGKGEVVVFNDRSGLDRRNRNVTNEK